MFSSQAIPLAFNYPGNSRALGLADMAKTVAEGRTDFRANCGQTFHVLELMEGFAQSGREHKEVVIESRFEKTPAMDPTLEVGIL